MAKALFHHGLAIEFDSQIPRLTIDGHPIPLPPVVADSTPEERAQFSTDQFIEYAKQHVDASEGFIHRDRIRDAHVNELKEGVAHWNEWRRTNPAVRPLLYDAKLTGEEIGRATSELQ